MGEAYVRLRGLPFSATQSELIDFLSGANVDGGEEGVQFVYNRDGRPNGEAYVRLCSADDVGRAMGHHREHMGSRYVEVFEVEGTEMDFMFRNTGNDDDIAVIRLRGLPFNCSKEEIMQFFTGYEILPNGIMLTLDSQGRAAGDAYVQFASQDRAEDACTELHMKRIGHRYIELFKSSMTEARTAQAGGGVGGGSRGGRGGRGGGGGGGGRFGGRPSPYDRDGRGGRGGPYGGFNTSYGGYGGNNGEGGGRGIGGFGGGRGGDGGGFGGGYGGFSGGRGGRGRDSGRGGGRGGGGRGGSQNKGEPCPGFRSQTGYSIHMRGLPFSAGEGDIAKFFSPLDPSHVYIGKNMDGRKSGEADVEFSSHQEACEAMKRDKCNMEHRYIELFLNSSSDSAGGGGGSNGFGPGYGNFHSTNF